MLRWFPRFQVVTTCFSCGPPKVNLAAIVYIEINPCHRVKTQVQFIIIITIIIIIIIIIIRHLQTQRWPDCHDKGCAYVHKRNLWEGVKRTL
jgi:hypothetical protein